MWKSAFGVSSLFVGPSVFALWQLLAPTATCATTSSAKNSGGFGVADPVLALCDEQKKQPGRDNDRLPTPPNDQDLIDDSSCESLADRSPLADEGATAFQSGDRAALTLRAPRTIRTLLPLSHLSLHSLDEHSRGRAPPMKE